MNTKNIIYYISIIIVLAFSFYLEGILGIINFVIFVILYSIIFFAIYYAWKTIKKKEILNYKDYFILFVKKISLSLVIIGLILTGFTYYQNEIEPAKMPEYTITNGDKTVIFQAMSHVGSEEFYQTIKENLIKAKQNGYVYFFEGVGPGTEENSQKFNKAIGIEFNKDLYPNFSKLYGVNYQDNTIYYGLVNELDFNVDVSIDYIMEEYEKLIATSTQKLNIPDENAIPIDVSSEIIKTLASLNDRELKVLVYINQAILNFIIKSNETKNLIASNFTNQALFDIILHGRNEVLADAIINSEYNKIYVTYGLLHFEGVLKLLQVDDPDWKIVDTNYLIPIK
ncbi:MAG: hypothetical protein PHH06_01845 [Candidatus Gracilibacteria bacterium]|nr:hypothetical protein [Candidatus Gracilibacteria bacterium]